MSSSLADRRAYMFLVCHGFATSRAKAQAAIQAGNVTVGARVFIKSAQILCEGAKVQYVLAHPYVSRGRVMLTASK